ncbi:substrate-binding periplasmic protein [Vibrio mangrovi]|uniref:Bacterial extracellular solute-binding proteins, family 3 n=1 Tax=Vibrio mangrovi TaxID=474394 RepID=A0A1Y6IPR0_9VIBR|nr:hypothetical protein [Vibrio mangrovi]MDW6003571.1 hypothetical protein [Vibrio mangrovi]SMR99637.1 hypothetical protein VIM7927_00864 [Vibrio mangrovi]
MLRLILVVVFMFSFNVLAREIKYPNLHGIGESTIGFAVLQLVLDKSGSGYKPVITEIGANARRTRAMLEKGQIDVMDGGFSPDLIKSVEPIYLPFDLGLLGWRVFITRKDTAERLHAVRNIEDLKAFSFGQGVGWNDTIILANAGLTVVTAPKIDNLINMVKLKRFDLFPLGANEAYEFLKLYGGGDGQLIVDDALTLVYPFGRFFYVRKGDQELKQVIETGMERALADGSLLALLKSHPFFQDAFEQANLSQRIQIRIDTPNLNEAFRSIDPKWWYSPDVKPASEFR